MRTLLAILAGRPFRTVTERKDAQMSDLMAETERAALIDQEAWKLLLNYAESGLEDDIDEAGEFDEDTYEEIQEKAWEILRELRAEHLDGGR
jgi:hypothetical protein